MHFPFGIYIGLLRFVLVGIVLTDERPTGHKVLSNGTSFSVALLFTKTISALPSVAPL